MPRPQNLYPTGHQEARRRAEMYIREAEALTGRGAPQSSSIKHVPIGREKGPGKETRHGYRFSTEPPGYRKMDGAVQRSLELPNQLNDLRPLVQRAAKEACSLPQTKSRHLVSRHTDCCLWSPSTTGFFALLSELWRGSRDPALLPAR